MKQKICILVSLGFIIILGSLARSFTEESIFIFPPEKNIFFKNYYYTGSRYIHFSIDGTYREITREHLFIMESDNGTWYQDSDGLITMISNLRTRNIEYGPFTIYTWHNEDMEELPELIENFLKKHREPAFSAETIGRLRVKSNRTPIMVDIHHKSISQKQLEELLKNVKDFLKSDTKNHSHCMPRKYKGFVFLLWENSERPLYGEMNDIKEKIDSLENSELPAYMFIEIGKEIFDEGIKTTQTFINE